jgi:hypothetical protein
LPFYNHKTEFGTYVEEFSIEILAKGANMKSNIMFVDYSISVLESLIWVFMDEPYNVFTFDARSKKSTRRDINWES